MTRLGLGRSSATSQGLRRSSATSLGLGRELSRAVWLLWDRGVRIQHFPLPPSLSSDDVAVVDEVQMLADNMRGGAMDSSHPW